MQWSWHPVQLSFFVAIVATFITFLLVLFTTYCLLHKNFKGRTLLETIFFLPLVLPPTVIGFLLIIVFGNQSPVGKMIEWFTGSSILFTVSAAIIAGATVAFPLMYQPMKAGFLSIDRNVVGAASVDGANKWKLFFKIMLPLSYRSIATGMILGFTRAFGEFGATLMFAGNIPGQTQTIPTAIYLAIETGNKKIASYYVLISIAFSFILLMLIDRKK